MPLPLANRCQVRAVFVVPDTAFDDETPRPDPSWIATYRTELAAWLQHDAEALMRGGTIRPLVTVLHEGDPGVIVLWDDDGATAEQSEQAALAVCEIVEDRYRACDRRARAAADAPRLWAAETAARGICRGEGTVEGRPLQVRDVRPGDLVTELDTPQGPWMTVVSADSHAGTLVLDPDDGHEPVMLAVDDWSALVLRA